MEGSKDKDRPARKFIFLDDNDRGKVLAPTDTSSFRPGDQVYYRASGTGPREGPYKIASVPTLKKYTLCHTDSSQTAKDGIEVEENELEQVTG
ncbi:hypothetical protein IMSHALPRED_003173 [Imshaugia aleurites]|uniref:Uncharacterized protein n=1 Tax=Imshaugia aleurites TaxID=172621 RepID=A0A8H3PJV3_9LECA|nr:hypothetical protein IMSHALPRED_003173 [Imshaugia aleurites]